MRPCVVWHYLYSKTEELNRCTVYIYIQGAVMHVCKLLVRSGVARRKLVPCGVDVEPFS